AELRRWRWTGPAWSARGAWVPGGTLDERERVQGRPGSAALDAPEEFMDLGVGDAVVVVLPRAAVVHQAGRPQQRQVVADGRLAQPQRLVQRQDVGLPLPRQQPEQPHPPLPPHPPPPPARPPPR